MSFRDLRIIDEDGDEAWLSVERDRLDSREPQPGAAVIDAVIVGLGVLVVALLVCLAVMSWKT